MAGGLGGGAKEDAEMSINMWQEIDDMLSWFLIALAVITLITLSVPQEMHFEPLDAKGKIVNNTFRGDIMIDLGASITLEGCYIQGIGCVSGAFAVPAGAPATSLRELMSGKTEDTLEISSKWESFDGQNFTGRFVIGTNDDDEYDGIIKDVWFSHESPTVEEFTRMAQGGPK